MGPLRHAINEAIVPRSLFWRSFLIVVVPLVVLQLVLTVIFYNRHWDSVTRSLSLSAAGQVAMLAGTLDATADDGQRSASLDRFKDATGHGVSLDTGQAGALAEAGQAPPLMGHIDSKISEAFAERLDRPFALTLRAGSQDRVAVRVPLEAGTLTVSIRRSELSPANIRLLVLWMVGASAALIAVAVYFLRLQVRPIRQLAEAVDSFGKGRDVGDFRLRGSSEIRRAATAFNTMRGRVLRHIAQRTQMLAAISHDLRTPLTRMRLELEMLPANAGVNGAGSGGAGGAGEAVAEMVEGLKSDVAEMKELVDTYLAFARGEEGESAEPTPLRPVLDAMRARAERAGARVTLDPSGEFTVAVRPLAFRRALSNLVDNACRHGRTVRLSASAAAGEVAIAVEDDGPGLPPELHQQVFQPFFRVDPARGRETGGTGLGLTIARDVALSHGGDVELGPSPLGGLKATLRLPA